MCVCLGCDRVHIHFFFGVCGDPLRRGSHDYAWKGPSDCPKRANDDNTWRPPINKPRPGFHCLEFNVHNTSRSFIDLDWA